MSGKGSISRMSDECLMKGKPGLLYFGEYQAGMRKFTLAGKSGLRCEVDHSYDSLRSSSDTAYRLLLLISILSPSGLCNCSTFTS